MRTSEERVSELHRRMDEMKQTRRSVTRIKIAAAGAAGLVAVVLLALFVAQVPVQYGGKLTAGAAASIIAERAVLGYMVIAVTAFCLGVLVTVFCFRLRREMEKEGQNHDRKL